MELIPSFLATNSKSFVIKLNDRNEIDAVKKILSFYDDHVFDLENTDLEVKVTRKKLKLDVTYSVSKVCVPGFNEEFKTKKVFDPIIIETTKKTSLGENLEILIKSLITNPNHVFDKDLDFKTLKEIFSLQGDDDFIIKKEDLISLLNYTHKLDATKFVSSERLKYGSLVGITDFRIGNKLYDIRNKTNINKHDFYQLYIYSLMLKKILGLEIKKLIILSPVNGEEYIMKIRPGGAKEKILDLYKKRSSI